MNGVRRFLAWWGGELAALVPARLRRAFAPSPARLLAWPTACGRVLLERREGGSVEPLGGLADAPQKLRRKLARAVAAGRLDVVLAIPQAQAVLRRVSLPLAAERELDAVLGYEMDRLTPFAASELFYARGAAARRVEQGKLDIDLVFAPIEPFAGAIAALDAAGLRPGGADLIDAQGAPTRQSLRAGDASPRRRTPPGLRLAGVGAVALAALLLVWAGLDQLALERGADAARAELALVRAEALARADRVREAAPTDAARLAHGMRVERALAVATLAALSAALPDDAWLTSLRLTPQRLEITGFASDAAALPAILDAETAFSAPRFLAPVTRDGAGERERFSLSVALSTPPASRDAP